MSALTELDGVYSLDPAHSSVAFVARHAMITNVRGTFEVAGTAELRGSAPDKSSVRVTIPVASVDTRNADRDAHLRGEDFFDAEAHPSMEFASKRVRLVSDDEVEVTGDLTIRGVTREITIPMTYTGSATDPFGAERVGFEGSVRVNRKDWGLTWNAALETGGLLVGETVKLEFEISAVKTG